MRPPEFAAPSDDVHRDRSGAAESVFRPPSQSQAPSRTFEEDSTRKLPAAIEDDIERIKTNKAGAEAEAGARSNQTTPRRFTLGIDLASQAKSTAACLLEWTSTGAEVVEAAMGCGDDELDALIRRADAVGIDAPLGWPIAFRRAVADWTDDRWETDLRDRLRFRLTDHRVRTVFGRWPLSVSTDLIALPAMRAMALLRRHGAQDRSGGDGRFFEVYPAATLHIWGLPSRGYKGSSPSALQTREGLLQGLLRQLPGLTNALPCADDDNLFDALVASMTARAAAMGLTQAPQVDERPTAVEEGWIHLPTAPPPALIES
jgi:hypothetical protein